MVHNNFGGGFGELLTCSLHEQVRPVCRPDQDTVRRVSLLRRSV